MTKPPTDKKPAAVATTKRRGPDKRPRASRVQLFIPLDAKGKIKQYKTAWDLGFAMINDPLVSVATKIKLVVGMLPYERPKLAQQEVGKKEARNKAAQTAGHDDEFAGLMGLPSKPRLAVDNSTDASKKKPKD